MREPKGVSILGSTGSIGTTTLALVERFPDRFRVVALAAGRRVRELKDQIERFLPELVSVADPDDARELRESLASGAARGDLARNDAARSDAARTSAGSNSGPQVLSGMEGLLAVATAAGTDVTVSALVGAVGLEPTLAAIDAGIDLALANKEVMVVAGELVRDRANASGARLLPVDSEHNAIFQALEGRDRDHLERIVLTASGGPFREKPASEFATITRAEALAHPTWDMGEKISIDSATLMNKGLEVIEARWLFDTPPDLIDVIVHPQSIVHSMVRYRDGSVVAVLAIPDMTIPVAYALSYPDLLGLDYLPSLDLAEAGKLTFFKPDRERFPCLQLAFDALRQGGTMPAVANAANEIAVARFLAGDIAFLDIAACVQAAMKAHEADAYESVADVLAADRWARDHASEFHGNGPAL